MWSLFYVQKRFLVVHVVTIRRLEEMQESSGGQFNVKFIVSEKSSSDGEEPFFTACTRTRTM